jgi:prepilin-type N-terminal cleavage/methylation domain-containing protein
MRYSKQSGFTLVELLVVTSLVGILSSLAVQNFSEYRVMAYDRSAEQLMHDAQSAVQAGMIDLQENSDPFLWSWVWSGGDGNFFGDVNTLTPGLKVGDNMRIWAFHDAWCETQPPNGWCAVVWVETAHCQGRTSRIWARYTDGTQLNSEWPNWGC